MPGPNSSSVPVKNSDSAEEVREKMRKYWELYSVANSVEEMMLDDSAAEIDKEERPEILSLLPPFNGHDILELGAGIGRFSAPLASLAKSVVAVDFMQSNCETNARLNATFTNLTVLCEDVTKLECKADGFDLVFSNWLMMYLSDEEVVKLAKNMLQWTKVGGHVFFRESCFHQSGNKARPAGNPSVYRSPQHYQHIFKSVSDGKFRFKMVMARTVETYARLKGNRNQICWLWQKVEIAEEERKGNATQEFLDNQQYALSSVLRYEKIFGRGFVSTGGKDTTEEFVRMLDLQPGQHVLDVGCGIGGSCFLMAEKYQVHALGLDLSTNMINIALERSLNVKLDVTFEIADATQIEFPEGIFDVVYSRDAILHIDDKAALFKRFFRFLRPGGKLLISDYCRGELAGLSDEFKDYVAQRGYYLMTVPAYADLIKDAGFVNVVGEDRTWQFVECLKKELDRMADPTVRSDFLQELSEADLKYLEDGWHAKLDRTARGDQKWGLFLAVKPE